MTQDPAATRYLNSLRALGERGSRPAVRVSKDSTPPEEMDTLVGDDIQYERYQAMFHEVVGQLRLPVSQPVYDEHIRQVGIQAKHLGQSNLTLRAIIHNEAAANQSVPSLTLNQSFDACEELRRRSPMPPRSNAEPADYMLCLDALLHGVWENDHVDVASKNLERAMCPEGDPYAMTIGSYNAARAIALMVQIAQFAKAEVLGQASPAR